MAPYPTHLLNFAVPTLAFLAGYFWYKQKTGNVQRDHIDPDSADEKFSTPSKVPEGGEGNNNKSCPPVSPTTPESAPIDIILPHTLRSRKSQQQFISDEDLDREIEKMKSSKYSSKGKAGGGSSTRNVSKNSASKRGGSSKATPKASFSSGNSCTDTDGSPQSVQQPIIIRCTPQKIISSNNTSTNVSPCDPARVDFKSPDTAGKINGTISSVREVFACENGSGALSPKETTSPQVPVEDIKELKISECVNHKPAPLQILSSGSEPDSVNRTRSDATLNGNAEECKEETSNDACINVEEVIEPNKVEDVQRTDTEQGTTSKTGSKKLGAKAFNTELVIDKVVVESDDTDNAQAMDSERNSNHNSINIILNDNFGESDGNTFGACESAKSVVGSNNNDIEDLRRTSERDSANHSPTDVMLAGSPSCSSISDNNSEVRICNDFGNF